MEAFFFRFFCSFFDLYFFFQFFCFFCLALLIEGKSVTVVTSSLPMCMYSCTVCACMCTCIHAVKRSVNSASGHVDSRRSGVFDLSCYSVMYLFS